MQPETPPKESTGKALLLRIWNALHRRPLQKLAALLIAFAFWAVVIASDPNRLTEKVILNAPVTVSGQDTLRARGLTVLDDIATGAITVKMRVQVKQSDYDKATADVFTPRLELASQITQDGAGQKVYFSVPSNTYGTVLSFEPEYVTLDVETYSSRSRVPIVVEQIGASASSIWINNPAADPAQVAVSGPKSLVDQVRRAVVRLPLSSLSEMRPQDIVTSQIELQDASGNPISSPLIRITNESINVDSVQIHVDVYPMKEIPVHKESAVTGIPGHGYELKDVRIVSETVGVAADADILAEIESLYVVDPISIAGATESVVEPAMLKSIPGIAHMAMSEVMIEADIVPATHIHQHNDRPVSIKGISPGLVGKLSRSEMDVVISGDYDKVQGLVGDDINLYVDAAGLGEGVHLLDVKCFVNGTDAFEYEPEYVQITLTLSKE